MYCDTTAVVMAMDSIIEDLQTTDTKSKQSALESLLPELKRHVELRHLEVIKPSKVIFY